MPHLTLTENPKTTAKPWFSHVLHRARKRSWSVLQHTQRLTYLPQTYTGPKVWMRLLEVNFLWVY